MFRAVLTAGLVVLGGIAALPMEAECQTGEVIGWLLDRMSEEGSATAKMTESESKSRIFLSTDQLYVKIDTTHHKYVRASVVGSSGVEFRAGYCEEVKDQWAESAPKWANPYGSSGNGYRYCKSRIEIKCPYMEEVRFKGGDCIKASPMRVRIETSPTRIWKMNQTDTGVGLAGFQYTPGVWTLLWEGTVSCDLKGRGERRFRCVKS